MQNSLDGIKSLIKEVLMQKYKKKKSVYYGTVWFTKQINQ